MKVRSPYHYPEDKKRKIEKAMKLEWWTVFFLLTIIGVMYFAMGSSQAMKTAWAEDILGLVPPVAFLITLHVRLKSPTEKFPYGYQRAATIAFLCAATALAIFGTYLLYESVKNLVNMEHPTIGMMTIFGQQVWMGWIMMAALAYSAIPPFVLGRMKLPLATELSDKTLYTDATMLKDDWLTALAGIIGITGIGFGWWWADSIAAGIIAFEVVKDGFTHLKEVISDLMNQRPTTVEAQNPDHLPEQLRRRLQELDWVAAADVRLRQEGDLLSGEAFLVPRNDNHLLDHLQEASDAIKACHWRFYDVTVVPLKSLEGKDGNY